MVMMVPRPATAKAAFWLSNQSATCYPVYNLEVSR